MARRSKGRSKSNTRAARFTLAPLPSLTSTSTSVPDATRLRNATVMTGEWADPAAITTGGAKTVRHWRAFDPIRRMAESLKSSSKVTLEHVAACDMLRRLWDAARVGLAGGKMVWHYHEPSAVVPTTPSRAAITQARASHAVRRCLQRFTGLQQELIQDVILSCRRSVAGPKPVGTVVPRPPPNA
jgi:hypothetical protein